DHGYARGETDDIDRRQPQRRAAVAELTVGVVAPALRTARAGDSAAMEHAGGNGRRAGHARDGDRGQPRRVGAVADFAGAVVAPALRRAGGGRRAHVHAAAAYLHHAGSEADDVDRRTLEIPGVVAEDTAAFGSPTFDRSIVEEGAAVLLRGGDRADA